MKLCRFTYVIGGKCMSLIEKALYTMINGKRTVTHPIFIKEFERENQQLKDLIELSSKVTSSKGEIIKRDINFVKYGLEGEQNVYYELKNSFLPMICLHDIRLEHDDYVAQFDFIIITKKFIYVLETKKLSGDIEITPDGDFIRTIRNREGKFIKKEGMYSPVSQNERHVKILKEILLKFELVKTFPIKSAIVIANPKTIVNKYKAPKSIQYNIHKYDQITNLLKKELDDKKNDRDMLEKYMYEIAEFLVKYNKPIRYDNVAKYSLTDEDFKETIQQNSIQQNNNLSSTNNKVEIKTFDKTYVYDQLKKFRLETSKLEGIKPYFIFNNEELDLLIESKPSTKEELLRVKGFGEKKVEKYGDKILEIING